MTGAGRGGGSTTMTQKVPENDPDPEGFKIYVRAPDGASVQQVTRFLEDFARLLSDEEKNITVELYDEFYDPDPDQTFALADDAAGAAKKAAAKKAVAKKKKRKNKHAVHPVGGPKSPLYPMYICHNKFV